MSQFVGRRVGAILIVVLLLSMLVAPAASASGAVVHVVQRGETLYSIAARYGVSMYAIAEANHLTNLNAIYAGMRLVIPAGPPPACPVYYRVQRGDNLTRIAARYGVSVAQLQQWNRITNPNRIYVGQTLVIHPPRCAPPPKPTPPPPPQAGNWFAQYYNNRDLAGAPVLERKETNLSYNWGYGSPAPQVFADNFSARWNRTFNLTGGTYRVTVRADDGVRVYIDGALYIDEWRVQAATPFVRDLVIVTGNHTFTVEFFEAEGVSEISFSLTKL